MRYHQYIFEQQNLEKRLGFLGEIHIYNSQESKLAKEVIKNYNSIAIEGTDNPSLSDYVMALPYGFYYFTFALGTKRSLHQETAEDIAKSAYKKINYLEKNQEFPIIKKMLLFAYGIFLMPLLPLSYCNLKLFGDPYKKNTAKNKKISFFNKYLFDVKKRDRSMAKEVIKIISDKKVNNLLVVCGDAHLEGITEFLTNELNLKKFANLEI